MSASFVRPRPRSRRRRRSRADLPGPLRWAAIGGAVVFLQLAGIATGFDSASAQEPTVVERQIPVDSARAVQEIGPELRRELGLFPEVEGFEVARLFRLEDGNTVLEISFREDGTLLRERRYPTEQSLASLRSRLAETGPTAEGRTVAGLDQDGRGRLVLGETLVGLGFYGWAVPEILDLDDERPVVAAYLLTAGASFYLPYRFTRNVPVRNAHRHMVLWGATRGALYGYLAASAVTAEEDFTRRSHLATSVGTSVAASYLGYRAVEWAGGVDEGTSVLWTTLADAGTLAGLGAAYVSGFFDEVLVEREIEDPFEGGPRTVLESEQAHPRAADLTALALTGAGLAAGRWLGSSDDYTPGDVSALRSMGILGAQATLPVAELFVGSDDDRAKRYVAGMLVGGAAGTVVGSRILRRHSLSSSDGLLLNAGHAAGGLAALGITWLLTGDDGDELLYTSTTAAGSALGLALTYRALDPERQAGRSEAGDRGIRVEIAPAGLLAGLMADPAGPSRGRYVPTLVRLRF